MLATNLWQAAGRRPTPMKRLILISPWFGPWPSWINFFIESCKWNSEIDWLIPTDQEPPENAAANVHFHRSSFAHFKQNAGGRLGIDLSEISPYKICDLRPAFGVIFEPQIDGYGSFGFCDLDVIFGDLGRVYDDDLLGAYVAISSQRKVISGHLSVFRNTPEIREMFRRIPGWQSLMSAAEHIGVDERQFTRLFRPSPWIKRLWAPKSLFVERYSTPGGPIRWPDGQLGPSNWIWKEGRLSHERGGPDPLYLHMMFWNSERWLPEHMKPAPWSKLGSVVQCDWREAAESGFVVSPGGITLLES